VLRLRSRLILLFLLFSLGLRGSLRSLFLWLLLLRLLLGRGVLDSLIDELQLTGDSSVSRLVVDQLIPTGNIGILFAELLAKDL